MSGREAVLGRVRRALAVGADDAARRKAVADRMANTPAGIVPARGQLAGAELVALFRAQATAVAASVQSVADPGEVPAAVAAYLRGHNLPAAIRMGSDERLAALPWSREETLELRSGASDGHDGVAVSQALAGIAETGTVMLASGPDNPTTLNFLPDHHIVVLDRGDLDTSMEAALARLRAVYGKGAMPRALNMVTGPSRSADIEQTLLLGAHGPLALHIILVG